jgi:hypothetical protein
MIQFNLTPVSGVIILNGKYLFDISASDDKYCQQIADFQLELSWDSDMLMGTTIKKILWLDPISEDETLIAEDKIRDAYSKIGKIPNVLMKDKLNDMI